MMLAKHLDTHRVPMTRLQSSAGDSHAAPAQVATRDVTSTALPGEAGDSHAQAAEGDVQPNESRPEDLELDQAESVSRGMGNVERWLETLPGGHDP